jgi:hypothetical protein
MLKSSKKGRSVLVERARICGTTRAADRARRGWRGRAQRGAGRARLENVRKGSEKLAGGRLTLAMGLDM